MENEQFVWVFNGNNSKGFPSGIFSSQILASEWIVKHKLSGVLTKYPINISVYDWAIKNEYFTPKNEKHETPEFISTFSSGMSEHYHYDSGKQVG